MKDFWKELKRAWRDDEDIDIKIELSFEQVLLISVLILFIIYMLWR